MVARISEMGADPSLLRDTLEAVAADRQRNKPEIEREQRQLQVEHQACRGEAKQLVAALATQSGGDGRSIIERLAELDQRAGQIEQRLTEIQETLAAIDRTTVKPDDVASALSLFNPVWEALTPRERANLLHILIDAIEYDGRAKEVAITLRPTGVASLAREAKSITAATGSAA